MSGRIPREFIDELLMRVDIVDLIDSHVPLKKTGANFVARCPFHSEKTPSFSVNRNKQFFHCFGCGASGNAISFLMEYSHLDFIDAVEELANFLGLDVPREASTAKGATPEKDNLPLLYELMKRAAELYSRELSQPQSATAQAYLAGRELSAEVIARFMVGYAPDDWQFLSNQLDKKLLLDAGLIVTKERGTAYDRFRNRIMFPIRDKRGRIVGFGGRVLDDSLPKYLNSPDTALFHKGKEVYGLYELLEKNSKPECILVVEGYMDVLALAQYGINYAVAALGTALSKAHLDLLFRFSAEIIFCFDGDKAGKAAAWRAMEPAFSSLKDGRQIRVMLLPEQHDPDSLIKAEGVASFTERLQSADPLSNYFFKQIQTDVDLSSLEGRAKLVNKASPYLDKLAEGVFKDLMGSKLQELSLSTGTRVYKKSPPGKLKKPKAAQPLDRMSSARVALALLLQNPKLADLVQSRNIEWQGLEFPGIDLFKAVIQLIVDQKIVTTGILLEAYRDKPEQKIVTALAALELPLTDEGVEDEFNGALDRLLAQARNTTIEKLLEKGKALALSAEDKELLRNLLSTK